MNAMTTPPASCSSTDEAHDQRQVRFEVLKHPEKADLEAMAATDGRSALILGDAVGVLQQMPDASVQTAITSPPYWSLRDYGFPEQIGLEESAHSSITALGDVLDARLKSNGFQDASTHTTAAAAR